VNVTLDNATMEPLANDLAGLIGEPVIDGTGLEGRYKISLHVSSDHLCHLANRIC
jgi:uncharacterized protein (TIGR03435 family)